MERKSCSFERIYFSRGSDASIYEERKNLGKYVFPKILKSIDSDISNSGNDDYYYAFGFPLSELQAWLDDQNISSSFNFNSTFNLNTTSLRFNYKINKLSISSL